MEDAKQMGTVTLKPVYVMHAYLPTHSNAKKFTDRMLHREAASNRTAAQLDTGMSIQLGAALPSKESRKRGTKDRA